MEAILASRARAITAELPCVTVVLPVVIAFTGPARWADNNGLVAAVFPARRTCETPPGHTGGAFFFFFAIPGTPPVSGASRWIEGPRPAGGSRPRASSKRLLSAGGLGTLTLRRARM